MSYQVLEKYQEKIRLLKEELEAEKKVVDFYQSCFSSKPYLRQGKMVTNPKSALYVDGGNLARERQKNRRTFSEL